MSESPEVKKSVVHKTRVPNVDDSGDLVMWLPKGAEVIKFGEQYNGLYCWFICDPEERESKNQYFNVLLTGRGTVKTGINLQNHIDTVIMHDGAFVVHIFRDDS